MPAIKRDERRSGNWRRLMCFALGDHERGQPERVEVGPQSHLGGRQMRCGRCGQVLRYYVNRLDGRLD